jgi:hypothetical protein
MRGDIKEQDEATKEWPFPKKLKHNWPVSFRFQVSVACLMGIPLAFMPFLGSFLNAYE